LTWRTETAEDVLELAAPEDHKPVASTHLFASQDGSCPQNLGVSHRRRHTLRPIAHAIPFEVGLSYDRLRWTLRCPFHLNVHWREDEMSYLAPLRLHFVGQFQAAVSTVNNDPDHFNNKTFKPEYQLLQKPNAQPTADDMRGWWNPKGSADWRFIGCAVTSAWYADGSSVGRHDPVLEMLVADSDRQAPAKLVDLDPEQQMVSTIFGLEVRICDREGRTLVSGKFVPAAFIDIWDRAPGCSATRSPAPRINRS
jgi:hypothetical protein